MSTDVIPLDKDERKTLASLEKVIESGVASFLATGSALKEIRDDRLYRENHKTFESYIKSRWGFEKSRAYQLIAASDIKDNLSTVVDVPKAKEINNERQLRELTNVPAESLKDVIVKASEIVGDEPLTAKAIKQAREEVLAPETKPEPPKNVWEDINDEPEEKPSKPLPKTTMSQSPDQLVPNIQAVGESLLSLIKEMDRLSDQVGGEWIDMQEVETRAKSLRKLIRGFAHWVDCPECSGKGCNGCKKRGWLCADRKQFLDQRQKDLLGVA